VPADRPESAPSATYPPAARNRRMLVVDDDPKVRGLLKRVLRLEGHRVASAGSARRALEILGTDSFDLVLTDLMMPDMTGAGLYEEIARRWPSMSDRVLFFTGAALTQDQEAFFRRVGRVVLRKPFRLEEIREAIDSALAEAAPRPRVAARAD